MSTSVVLVSGGFDPIHSGHISLLRSAKQIAPKSALAVGLNSDSWLAKKKGKPFMTLDERITGSFLMEKYTSMGKSFEDSDERDIFQCWITNNRTTNEKRHEDLKDTFKEIIRRETDQ